jgi:hypothetical protein
MPLVLRQRHIVLNVVFRHRGFPQGLHIPAEKVPGVRTNHSSLKSI